AVDQPLDLTATAAALQFEHQPVVEHVLPVLRNIGKRTHEALRDDAQVRLDRVVTDFELDHRDLVVRVRQGAGRVVPHATVDHLHRVGQIDDVSLGGRGGVLVLGEVDDHFTALGGPELEVVPRDRVRQQPAVGGDL